jgi:MFS family permease
MTDVAKAGGPVTPVPPLFSSGYKGVVLSFLLAAYTFNFIDRTIIATIGPAIMADLKLSSTQMGLLGGLYFALLYTLLGIPIARLAERFNRVNIIAISLVVWSGFTALCGLASNYLMLAAFRFGVGIGEAGCSPPAHSLISDYYEPRKRASALSIYAFGIPLGTMFGAVAGGWLADNLGWRWAFIALGLPGIILAILFKMMVKEPPRGWSDVEARKEAGLPPEPVRPKPAFSLGEELRELLSVTKTLFTKWPVVNMVLGVTIASFGSYGSGQFVPQYFVGAFGLSLATVGLITGLVGGFSSGIGTLLGGFIADRMAKLSPAWYALTPAFGLLIATPIYIAAYLAPSWQWTAAILLIPGIFHYTYLGPTFGVVQNSVDTRRRATATAILFFFLNLIALGGGPPFIGWVIDQLSQGAYAAPTMSGVLAPVMGLFAGAGEAARSFAADCPGGRAPEGAGAAAVEACRTAWASGTRNGIIVAFLFYAWASVHYFLAAIGLAKHMRERAAIQAA